jgi:hypothetical protein
MALYYSQLPKSIQRKQATIGAGYIIVWTVFHPLYGLIKFRLPATSYRLDRAYFNFLLAYKNSIKLTIQPQEL